MENEIIKSKPSMLKHSSGNAFLMAVALIILSIIFYLIGKPQSQVLTALTLVVIIIGLIYSIKLYRDENLGGFITYGQSVGYSALIGLFTGIITGVFSFVLLSYIAPDILVDIRQNAAVEIERQMFERNPNISDSELDTIINMQMRFMTPGVMLISSIIATTFFSIVSGLIISIFLQRKNPEELL